MEPLQKKGSEICHFHIPASRTPPTGPLVGANWERYSRLLSERLQPSPPAATPNELDTYISELHITISGTLAVACRPGRPRHTRTETWNTDLSELELKDGSTFTAKILRCEKPKHQPLHGQQGLAYSAKYKAEVFADTMEEQFRSNAGIYDQDYCEHVEEALDYFFHTDPEVELKQFTLEEVQAFIKKSKPRKAHGLDNIGADLGVIIRQHSN
ncbi:hypothetical protein J6590_001781 [Homalodisca vitripennis]|nr:hypothetical protein J6590_001781 [Homalodisca vitripennis]